MTIRIWENFYKKDLKKEDDFEGQLVFEREINEEEFDISMENDEVSISFGHGTITLTPNEFFKAFRA